MTFELPQQDQVEVSAGPTHIKIEQEDSNGERSVIFIALGNALRFCGMVAECAKEAEQKGGK